MPLPAINFSTYELAEKDKVSRKNYTAPINESKYRAGYYYCLFGGFYHFDPTRNKTTVQTWKLRVSVILKDYNRALNLLLPVLMQAEMRFKVFDPKGLPLNGQIPSVNKRFTLGAQFTIYACEGIDSEVTLKPLVDQINDILTTNEITPGDSPSDIVTYSQYVSMRNDYVNGEYVPVTYSGRNYDLENNGCPFKGLLRRTVPFNGAFYFCKFNINNLEEFLIAFRFTMLACVRPYIDITETGTLIKEQYNDPSSELYNDILIALFIHNRLVPDNFLSYPFSLMQTNFSEIAGVETNLTRGLTAAGNFVRSKPIFPAEERNQFTLNQLVYGNEAKSVFHLYKRGGGRKLNFSPDDVLPLLQKNAMLAN